MNYFEFYQEAYSDFDQDFPQIRKFLTDYASVDVVELGAGTGRTLPLYENRNLIAVEPNKNAINFLSEKSKGLKNLKILNCSSWQLPIESASQDAVLIPFGGIAEMYPIFFTLSEICRILKDGGHLYFVIPNEKCFRELSNGVRVSNESNSSFDFCIENIDLPNFGKYEFQTIVSVRTENDRYNYTIEQTFPSIQKIDSLLSAFGMKKINQFDGFGLEKFEEKSSSLFSGVYRKTELSQVAPRAENSILAQKIYDGLSSKYTEIVQQGEYSVPGFLKENIGEYRELCCSGLDLGCANGFIGDYLIELGISFYQLFGLDVSPEMVNVCKKSPNYTNAEVWDLSAGLPLFKARQFDIVTCFGVMEFLENKETLVSDIISSLRIGGEAFLSFELNDELEEVGIKVGESIFKRYPLKQSAVEKLFPPSRVKLISVEQGNGYKSPTTNEYVPYLFLRIRRITV